MSSPLTRRRFLQTTAAIGGAGFFSGRLSAMERSPSANDRLQVGVIGVAGQGQYNWTEAARVGVAIVALCDVDERFAGAARQQFPQATSSTSTSAR